MDTELVSGTIELDDIKRCYVDIKVKMKCPNCDNEVCTDLSDNYLSYPKLNQTTSLSFYCDTCDTEMTMGVKIVAASLSLELHRSEITVY